MNKEDKIKSIVEEYLYERDDILDLNDVPELARDIAEKLNAADWTSDDK